MELLDFLLESDDSSSDGGRDWNRSVFDSDRFRNNSGNWVDWEDVSTGATKGTDLIIRIMMVMRVVVNTRTYYNFAIPMYNIQTE